MEYVFSTIMMTSPVLPYIPQYRAIAESKSAAGFSPWVCLILLAASILRVCFWVGKRFELTLLWQAIFMIAAQLVLLELCVRLRKPGLERKTLLDMHAKDIWDWDDYVSYVVFIAAFAFFFGLLTLTFVNSTWIIESLGFVSLMTEATLGMPQVLKNNQRKSVAGVSPILIGSWFLGDAFKTGYFLANSAPGQFILCGCIQLVVDCIILYQFYVYSGTKTTRTL